MRRACKPSSAASAPMRAAVDSLLARPWRRDAQSARCHLARAASKTQGKGRSRDITRQQLQSLTADKAVRRVPSIQPGRSQELPSYLQLPPLLARIPDLKPRPKAHSSHPMHVPYRTLPPTQPFRAEALRRLRKGLKLLVVADVGESGLGLGRASASVLIDCDVLIGAVIHGAADEEEEPLPDRSRLDSGSHRLGVEHHRPGGRLRMLGDRFWKQLDFVKRESVWGQEGDSGEKRYGG